MNISFKPLVKLQLFVEKNYFHESIAIKRDPFKSIS